MKLNCLKTSKNEAELNLGMKKYVHLERIFASTSLFLKSFLFN